VIGLPWTLVVAELGTLLGFVWLVLSPARELRTLPGVEHEVAVVHGRPTTQDPQIPVA
jgi:hypothetical protein